MEVRPALARGCGMGPGWANQPCHGLANASPPLSSQLSPRGSAPRPQPQTVVGPQPPLCKTGDREDSEGKRTAAFFCISLLGYHKFEKTEGTLGTHTARRDPQGNCLGNPGPALHVGSANHVAELTSSASHLRNYSHRDEVPLPPGAWHP